MPAPESVRDPRDVYDDAGMVWSLRNVGAHLHPGSESATVALAERAAGYSLATGGRILEVAFALGTPVRFLARRFAATVVCVDMDLRMQPPPWPGTGAKGSGSVPAGSGAHRAAAAGRCHDGCRMEPGCALPLGQARGGRGGGTGTSAGGHFRLSLTG